MWFPGKQKSVLPVLKCGNFQSHAHTADRCHRQTRFAWRTCLTIHRWSMRKPEVKKIINFTGKAHVMSVVNHAICVFILQIFPMLRGHGLHSTTLDLFFVDKALSSMETSVHWVTVKPCVRSHLDVSVSPRRLRHLGITHVKSTLMKMRL